MLILNAAVFLFGRPATEHWAAGCGTVWSHSAGSPRHAGSEPWPVITALQSGSPHCPHSPAGSGLFREAEECRSDWLTCNNTKTKKGVSTGEASWLDGNPPSVCSRQKGNGSSSFFFMKSTCGDLKAAAEIIHHYSLTEEKQSEGERGNVDWHRFNSGLKSLSWFKW